MTIPGRSTVRVYGTPSAELLDQARARVQRASNSECAAMLEHIVGQMMVAHHADGNVVTAVNLATAINVAWRSLYAEPAKGDGR